jgi:transcription elongation factor Elf1
MSNDERKIEQAMELALSCRRCGHPTDANLDKTSNIWTTYCDCGKTNKHSNNDIMGEATELMKTMPKKKS